MLDTVSHCLIAMSWKGLYLHLKTSFETQIKRDLCGGIPLVDLFAFPVANSAFAASGWMPGKEQPLLGGLLLGGSVDRNDAVHCWDTLALLPTLILGSKALSTPDHKTPYK